MQSSHRLPCRVATCSLVAHILCKITPGVRAITRPRLTWRMREFADRFRSHRPCSSGLLQTLAHGTYFESQLCHRITDLSQILAYGMCCDSQICHRLAELSQISALQPGIDRNIFHNSSNVEWFEHDPVWLFVHLTSIHP